MYPSSSSSSSHRSTATPSASGSAGLIRYGSAPGSFLTRAVDSVIGTNSELLSTVGSRSHNHRYFSGDSSSVTTESTCKATNNIDLSCDNENNKERKDVLQRSSYGLNELGGVEYLAAGGGGFKFGGGGGESSSSLPTLVRHSSSPAGFLNYSVAENGFARGPTGSYNTNNNNTNNNRGGSSYNGGGHGTSRLNPQLSFTRQDSSLSQISENSENAVDNGVIHRESAAPHSYHTSSSYGGSGGMDSWENSPRTIVFSNSSNKRAKTVNSEFLNCLDTLETQYSMPQTSLEMAAVEKLLQIPEDSVPCKTRAKRGFATHPRSIAERERRTRISGKLKKLQDLVPNMDKQTSYADMLDLAVQHIKGLQNQVQKLNKDLESCTCGCKTSHDVCQQ